MVVAKCGAKWQLSLVFLNLLATALPTKDSLLRIWACNPAQFVSGDQGSVHAFMLVLRWSTGCSF